MALRRSVWVKVVASCSIGLAILFLLYSWFDAAISLDHARQEQKAQRARLALLQEILRRTTKYLDRSQIAQAIDAIQSEHIVRRESDRISIDGTVFMFKHDSSISVDFTEDQGPAK